MEAIKFVYETSIGDENIDIYGHVNNAQYLVLFEKARWDMFKPKGLNREVVKDIGVGPIITELKLKFRKELSLNDEIRIETKFVGKKNYLVFNVEQKMFCKDQLACEAFYDFAIFDTKKRKLQKLTQEWLSYFGIE